MSALDITLSLSTSLLVIALVVLGYFYYVARNSAAAPAVCDTASLQQQLADAQSRLQQTNIRCPTCATPAPCPVCPAVPKYKIPISVTDQGYGNSSDATKLKRGYYDAQGQGLPLDYCRLFFLELCHGGWI
jgi:zona occludens toxin (predicted ATPase)